MIDDATITRFLTDLRAHVLPADYDGEGANSCLIGQLHAHISDLLPDDYRAPEHRVAAYYGLPSAAVEAIFTTAAEDAFSSNLEAAFWMAEYLLRNWTANTAKLYYREGYAVERAVARTWYASVNDHHTQEQP